MERQVEISNCASVNPRHVIAVLFDQKNLKTKIVLLGGGGIESDKTFKDTVKALNG